MGSEEKKSVELTEEQREVLRTFWEEDKVKVNAYAGTGKTTTLRAIASSLGDAPVLVLAYNRSIVEELKRKFPHNCSVYTLHSLAYRLRGFLYRDRIVDRKTFLDEVIDLLGVDYAVGKLLVLAFEAFCNSEFTEISEENFLRLLGRNRDLRKQAFAVFSDELSGRVLLRDIAGELADKVEYLFFAIERGVLPVTHDFYLKDFHLHLEDYFSYFETFKAVLVDEGQDVNGVQEEILVKVPVQKKLIVGDKHQQIYSWRNAINSLARLKGWKEVYLTRSFRFNDPEVVYLANRFLRDWKGEEKELFSEGTKRKTNKVGYIARTNAGLVFYVIQEGKKFSTTRSLKEIFKVVRESARIVEYFYRGNEEVLSGLPRFLVVFLKNLRKQVGNVRDLSSGLLEIGEVEYANGILLADTYDVEAFYDTAVKLYDPEAPNVFTTAHSSKGLEFDVVYFWEDFSYLPSLLGMMLKDEVKSLEDAGKVVEGIKNSSEEFGHLVDEVNLYYVALTRSIGLVGGPGYDKIKKSFLKPLTPELLWGEVRKMKNSKGWTERLL